MVKWRQRKSIQECYDWKTDSQRATTATLMVLEMGINSQRSILFIMKQMLYSFPLFSTLVMKLSLFLIFMGINPKRLRMSPWHWWQNRCWIFFKRNTMAQIALLLYTLTMSVLLLNIFFILSMVVSIPKTIFPLVFSPKIEMILVSSIRLTL